MTSPAPQRISGTKFWTDLSLPKVEALTTTIRTMFINIGFFAVFLLLIPSIISQFTRSQVVIEPIVVPTVIARQGLKPDVVANRLWDALGDFASIARDGNRQGVVTIPNSQVVQFSLPTAGVSIDSIFAMVRRFLGIYETRISGELVCSTADCVREGWRLRLRITKGASNIVDLEPMGSTPEAEYFRDAAAGVFLVLDPFVAIAALADTEPVRAAVEARRLIRENHPDAKWAHNVLGDIHFGEGEVAAAAEEFGLALGIDPFFTKARANLGKALLSLGDLEGARTAFNEVETADPRNVDAAEGFASLALADGDLPGAVKFYALAAVRAPLNSEYLVLAAQYAGELGDEASAERYLKDALGINPSDTDALRLLGDYYAREGRRSVAEKYYRDWADYDQESVPARLALAAIRVEARDFAGALDYYDAAIALGDTSAETASARAEAASKLAGP